MKKCFAAELTNIHTKSAFHLSELVAAVNAALDVSA